MSKIERGEVLPKPQEIDILAKYLRVNPLDFLLDIDNARFNISDWAKPFCKEVETPSDGDVLAIFLGAAVRMKRLANPLLTIATMEREFGIQAVNLSRIENATKPLEKISARLRQMLINFFNVTDEEALKLKLGAFFEAGMLDPYIGDIRNPVQRMARTARHSSFLRTFFSGKIENDLTLGKRVEGTAESNITSHHSEYRSERRAIIRTGLVYGSPLNDGTVKKTPVGKAVQIPESAGPNAWAMLVCRPTLGLGLPGRTVVIVDPDQFPNAGSLAVIDEGDRYRLVAVSIDKDGELRGYSERPAADIPIEGIEASRIHAVVAAIFD